MMPNIDDIMEWESGEMDEEREVAFFQGLINSGMAWRLQGCYGRRAMQFIKAGLCSKPKREFVQIDLGSLDEILCPELREMAEDASREVHGG